MRNLFGGGMMKQLVMYSGGVGSWAAASRLLQLHPTEDVALLFTDTKMEDEDLYRFLHESADDLGCELVVISDGRDPWEVFMDVRYLGNTRADPCSRILKREIARKWVDKNYEAGEVTVNFGIDWSEQNRMVAVAERWKPHLTNAPMVEPPLMNKNEMVRSLAAHGIAPPRLYSMGFPHNNCGGFCIKAGQAQFRLLLEQFPCRYAGHERKEQELREHLGKDVAILRDRTGGTTKPMTMKAFRERIQSGGDFDLYDWGGCGCFA